MTCALRIERDGEYRLSLTFDGPVELGAALAAVVARYEAGEPMDGPLSAPVSSAPTASPSAPRKRTSTERSRDLRARRKAAALASQCNAPALHATPDATGATLHATGPVAVASASRSADSSSLSPASAPSLGENAREGGNGCNGATATDATRVAVASVDLDAPMPDWARARVDTLAMTLGPWPASFDAATVWAGYLGNLARAREEGRVTAMSPAGWQKWLTDQRRIEARGNGNGRRIVQRDPPGPKAYRQATPDDDWDDEEKTA